MMAAKIGMNPKGFKSPTNPLINLTKVKLTKNLQLEPDIY